MKEDERKERMEYTPLISVIVPVYNAEQYLDECIESILKQTYRNLEIILVDDGSHDNSPAICDSYAVEYPKIKVMHKENGGPMSACVEGIKMASGEYLSFIDSDDWIDSAMIEDLVREVTGNKREIICSNYIIEKENQSIKVKQSLKPGIYDRQAIEEKLFPTLLGEEGRRIHGSRCMKLISKPLLLDNLPYFDLNVTMGEDLFLIILSILDAVRIVVVKEGYYYHYRFVEGSLVHKYKPQMYHDINILYEQLKWVLKEKVNIKEQRERLLQQLQAEYIFLFFFVLKNELRGPKNNYIPRIITYVKEAKTQKNLESTEVAVSSKANKLLYYIWKKPGCIRIAVVRFIIQIFDHR